MTVVRDAAIGATTAPPGWLTPIRLTRAAQAVAVAFLLAGLATFLLMRDMMVSSDRAIGADFLGVYAAGVLAREGQPARAYDHHAIAAVERRVLPQADYFLAWPYPPVFQLVARALAELPYVWAYVLWAAISLVAYVLAMQRAFGGSGPAFWSAMASANVYINVLHGQNGLLSAALMAAGLVVLRARPVLAGIAIGALCYKPHLGLPIGILLLSAGRWPAVLGAALSVATLGGASLLVLGSEVWDAFLHSGASTRALLESPELPLKKLGTVFSSARLLGVAAVAAYVLQGLVAALVLLLAVLVWRGPADEGAKAALAVAAVPLVTPYLFDYDYAILALPIGVLLSDGLRHGWPRATLAILILAWLAPIIAPDLAGNTGIQILPLASAALFWAAWRHCRRTAVQRSLS